MREATAPSPARSQRSQRHVCAPTMRIGARSFGRGIGERAGAVTAQPNTAALEGVIEFGVKLGEQAVGGTLPAALLVASLGVDGPA